MIIFIIVCVIQVIYGLVFFFSFLTEDWVESQEETPISVVICARNAAHELAENLPYILECLRDIDELVIVDDHSDDETPRLLSALDDLRIQTEMNPNRQGKKWAQRWGVERSSHEYILVTDADCRPISSDWIRSIANQIRKPLTLLYSPYRRSKGVLGFMVQAETFMTALQYLSYAQFLQPYMGVGRNMLFAKSAYLGHAPLGDDGLPYGDDDLFVSAYAQRSNTTVNYHSDTWTVSAPPATWKKWYAQKSRHASTGKRYRLGQKLELILFPASLLAFYLIPLELWDAAWWILAFVVRNLIFLFFYSNAVTRLGYRYWWWALPLFELAWLLYLFVVSPFIFILDKKKW